MACSRPLVALYLAYVKHAWLQTMLEGMVIVHDETPHLMTVLQIGIISIIIETTETGQ